MAIGSCQKRGSSIVHMETLKNKKQTGRCFNGTVVQAIVRGKEIKTEIEDTCI